MKGIISASPARRSRVVRAAVVLALLAALGTFTSSAAAGTFTSSGVDVGHSLQLTSPATSGFAWSDDKASNFSDATINPTTWTPTEAGAHDISDGAGGTQTITVDPDPFAAFSGPSSADAGHKVTFDATGSTGTGLSYEWDLGTGSFSSGTAKQDWTPPATGTQTIRLRITDENGVQDTVSKVVDVIAAPVAGFSGPSSADVGHQVTFDGTGSTGTGLLYEWDLGTGSFSSGASTQDWTPTTTGPQTIRLRITDENGVQDTLSKVVDVIAAPVASLLASAPAADVGQAVTLASNSTGTGLTESWQDSQPASFSNAAGQLTSWTPTTPGSHTVKLTVTDTNGVQSSVSQGFVVSSRPVAAITFSPANPVVGQPMAFHSASTGGAGTLAQAWDLTGTGAFFAAATDPSWTPATAGAHGIALRVTDANGVSSEAFVAFTVAAPPSPPAPSPPSAPDSPAPSQPAPPGWLVPFPIVVFSGHVGHRSATFTHFVVQAPNGARITVHCRGNGCPRGSIVKVASARHGIQSVRLRKLERRLSAGAVIEVFVRSPGLIGKYTKITVLSTQAPRRSDACLMPGSARPSPCPAS